MSRKTRRLIWSAPLVAALAVVGALTIFLMQGPGPAQAHDLPGAAMNLSAMAVSTSQIDLSWDAPSSGGMPTGYRIDRSMDGNVWQSLAMDHAGTAYSDTGLPHTTSYYYRVFAVNAAGAGPVSRDYTVQTMAPTLPGTVRGLTATAQGAYQINLAWSPPADDGGEITHYLIHWAEDEGTIPGPDQDETNANVVRVNASSGTAYEHTMTAINHDPLLPSTRYRYVLYAHNSAGKSPVGTDVVSAVTAPATAPDSPTEVTAVWDLVNGIVLIYWYSDDDSPVTYSDAARDRRLTYQVEVKYNAEEWAEISGTTPARADIGRWSDDETQVPEVSTQPYTDTAGNGTGAAVTKIQYRVRAVRDGVKSMTPTYSNVLDDTEFASVQPAAPVFPVTPSEMGGAVRDPFGNVSLTWTAPATATDGSRPPSISGYRIDVSDDGLHWQPLVRFTSKTETEYYYHDPERKRRYYRIFAFHAQYMSQSQESTVWSQVDTSGIGPPGPVQNFTAMGTGPDQISLNWDEPDDNGGAPIIGYRVDAVRRAPGESAFGPFITPSAFDPFSPPSDLPDGRLVARVDGTEYTHAGRVAGETWIYRVLAVTDDGAGLESSIRFNLNAYDTRIATTQDAMPAQPPEDLVAEDAKDSNLSGVADRGVLLLWNEAEAGVGGAIDGYRIQRMSNGGAWETIASDTNSLHTDYTDTDEPAENELRAYRVAALDGSIVGMYTDPVYYPHALAMHNNPPMVGTAIANQTVMVGSTVMVPSTITDPDAGDMLTWDATSDMDAVATAMVDGTGMVTITGMMEGMATITVTAMDGSGASAMQSFMVTVQAAQLTAPTNVMATVDDSNPGVPDVMVTWTNGMGAAQHAVILFDEDFNFGDRIAGQQDDEMHTFRNVPSGTYTAVVVALDAEYEMELEFAIVTVP